MSNDNQQHVQPERRQPTIDTRAIVAPLIAAVAPEVAHELYVLPSSLQPPRECRVPGAWGCTSTSLDLTAEHWLHERGEWHGRGPAIHVDDMAVVGDALKDLLAVVIHEIGHVFAQGIDRRPPTRLARQQAAVCVAYSADTFPGLPPWFGHDARWIRATLHLAYRSPLDIGIGRLADLSEYGVRSPLQVYWHAILPECRRLRDASLWELAIHRPPQEFIDTWRADVEAYHAEHPELPPGEYDRALNLFGSDQ